MVTPHSSDSPHSDELDADPGSLLVVTLHDSEIPNSESAIQGQNMDDNTPDLSTETGPHMTSSPKRNKDDTIVPSTFYEVTTAEGGNVMHISQQDIMSKSCSVKMLNLMEQEVKELQDSHKSGMLSSTSSPESCLYLKGKHQSVTDLASSHLKLESLLKN